MPVRKNLMILRAASLLLIQWLLAAQACAETASLEQILSRDTPPPGVVFEIAERDPRALDHVLPWVKRAAQRLRERFPGLAMALVSHGQEMFALQSQHSERHAAAHQLVQSLKRDDGIPVHVCETHAGWKGVAPEAFPDYVDVAPSGPAQVGNYLALDYVRIIVPRAAKSRQLAE
jgi:intracellular sulfur oxidation DsrE/DsrF family protein